MPPSARLPGRVSGPRRRLRAADLPALLATPRDKRSQQPTVLLAGKFTALASPGGGETQLLTTAQALCDLGVQARLWRPWEDKFAEADCLHLFGSEPEHLPLVDAARRQKIPVVISTIAWFDLASRWREPRSLVQRSIACGKFLTRAALPGLPSWRRRLYHAADLLLPNSQVEAQQLTRYFGILPQKIHVVPNGADPRFAEARPQAFAQLAGERNFVLYAGRIEPRKNQFGFLQAMQGTDFPIVILGDVVPGHESYLDACRRIAGPHVRFVDRLQHDDPLLASAYAACGCLTLTSWYETPGLVALEAGMLGTPLVLTDRGCTQEYFGDLARYVSPDDPAAIRSETHAAFERGRDPQLARLVREKYTWQAAAEATRLAYEKVLGRKTSRSESTDEALT